MIGTQPEADQFITDHRWAVLTTLRADGQPVSSVVAYAREGDTLLVSTPGSTFKRRSLDREPRLTLCIISNREPFNFVSVEGRATIETSDLVAGTRRVFENLAATGYKEPQDLEGWLTAQERVLIRIHADRIHAVIR